VSRQVKEGQKVRVAVPGANRNVSGKPLNGQLKTARMAGPLGKVNVEVDHTETGLQAADVVRLWIAESAFVGRNLREKPEHGEAYPKSLRSPVLELARSRGTHSPSRKSHQRSCRIRPPSPSLHGLLADGSTGPLRFSVLFF
jgi:hypothetical protein